MGHSLYTETKGGGGAVEEERAGPQGEKGERGRWKRREGPLCVSFQDGFYGVTSNADLPHPAPTPPLSLHPSVQLSLPPFCSLLYMAKWTLIGYSFMRLISTLAAPPTGRGLFLLPLKSRCICVYIVNMPDRRYQVFEGGCTGWGLYRHFS